MKKKFMRVEKALSHTHRHTAHKPNHTYIVHTEAYKTHAQTCMINAYIWLIQSWMHVNTHKHTHVNTHNHMPSQLQAHKHICSHTQIPTSLSGSGLGWRLLVSSGALFSQIMSHMFVQIQIVAWTPKILPDNFLKWH